MAVQSSYAVNPDVGFLGSLAEPNSPHRVEAGVLHVPSGAARANPRPGDSLYYDTTENAWACASTAAQSLSAAGILTYRADDVANVNSFVQYSDGDEIEIATMGVFWLIAGGAIERSGQVEWDIASPFDWNALSRQTGITALRVFPVFSANRDAVAAAGIFKAAIGYGRVI